MKRQHFLSIDQNIASATSLTKRFQNSQSLQSQYVHQPKDYWRIVIRLVWYFQTTGRYNTNNILSAAVTTANFPAHIMRYASIVSDIHLPVIRHTPWRKNRWEFYRFKQYGRQILSGKFTRTDLKSTRFNATGGATYYTMPRRIHIYIYVHHNKLMD